MAGHGAYANGPNEVGSVHLLKDFVNIADLPTTVSVFSGSHKGDGVQIRRGDVLLLRSHLPKEVTLSFNSEDSGRKDIPVSLDSCLKFVVLPPKNKGQLCDNHESLYPTVSDLLKDCPTYFQATQDYDDPYLPGFSVKQGDKFWFVRTFRDPRDDKVRLECKDSGGNIIRLSSECRGHFRVLEDRTAYTIRELINQARVSRRLRLSNENVQLQPIALKRISSIGSNDAEPPPEENPPSPVANMPLTFKGIIYLRKPEEMMEVSPWGDLETRWKIPVDVKLNVRQFSQYDYEVPVKRKHVSLKIEDFIKEYEDDFPVMATIVNYPHMHSDLANHLKNVSDVIVHKVKRIKRLIARTKTRYFSIDGNLRVSFSEYPKSFRMIGDLLECPPGTEVRVMEDVFSDFPRPFCLRYGDILRLVSGVEKYKMKKSSIKECEVVRFQRIGEKGYCIPILLPPDLEVKTLELINYNSHKPHLLDDIISGARLPERTVTVLQEGSESSLPLPGRFRLLHVVSDDVLVVSPLGNSATQAISPILETCVEIPIRHTVHFAYERKLEFPVGYFVFPRQRHIVSVRVEKVSETVASAMKTSHSTYEDVSPSTTETSLRLPRSLSAGALDRVKKRRKNPLQRLSKVLNPTNWRKSRAPTTLHRLSQEPPTPTNHYQVPLPSPGARSQAEEDPYEQINIQLGASLASANRTYSSTDIGSNEKRNSL